MEMEMVYDTGSQQQHCVQLIHILNEVSPVRGGSRKGRSVNGALQGAGKVTNGVAAERGFPVALDTMLWNAHALLKALWNARDLKLIATMHCLQHLAHRREQVCACTQLIVQHAHSLVLALCNQKVESCLVETELPHGDASMLRRQHTTAASTHDQLEPVAKVVIRPWCSIVRSKLPGLARAVIGTQFCLVVHTKQVHGAARSVPASQEEPHVRRATPRVGSL